MIGDHRLNAAGERADLGRATDVGGRPKSPRHIFIRQLAALAHRPVSSLLAILPGNRAKVVSIK